MQRDWEYQAFNWRSAFENTATETSKQVVQASSMFCTFSVNSKVFRGYCNVGRIHAGDSG